HRRQSRALRARQGAEPKGFVGTWMNIAFTFNGLKKLWPQNEVEDFADPSFRAGQAAQSGLLGDPTNVASPEHPNQWVVGGPANSCDVLLIIGSDDPTQRDRELIAAASAAGSSGLTTVYRQL